MFIATKAGILPPSARLPARLARRMASAAGTPPPRFARAPAHRFLPAQVRASVEESLSELGSGWIDLLLLHEAALPDVTDDLIALLQDLRSDGLIGAYGLATGRAETRAILAAFPGQFAFAQVPDSLWLRQQDGAGFPGVAALATHSLLGPAFADLSAGLAREPARRARWRERLGMDPLDTAQLARLFLAEALAANGHGPVIFSSGKPPNVRANVEVLADPPAAWRIEGLRALVQEECAATPVDLVA